MIIPFSAGGGSDTFARIIVQAIREENLLQQPIVVINVNGASGTIGSRRVKNARPDGYTIMMLHDAIFTAKHTGLTSYGAEAFAPIAATGEVDLVLTVQEDSPFNSLSELVEYASQKPDELVYGTAIGSPTHIMGLLLEEEHGTAKFRYTQAGSGSQRIVALNGGHIDLSPFSVEEYLRYESTGIKALAVFSEKRHPNIPSVPTAKEQGFDLNAGIRNFWWAPKGTPQEHIDTIAAVLAKAMATEYVREKLDASAISPSVLMRDNLDQEIARRDAAISNVSIAKTDAVPRFELWVLGLAAALLTAVVVRNRQALSAGWYSTESKNLKLPLCIALTFFYASTIALELSGYAIATTLYAFTLCVIVGGFSLPIIIRSIPFAATMGFGLYYLFTQVLTIDLPR
ncbi:tripartite tricarboxylate transporter substrate-binding protein [Pelagicoccus mobilis]|uniref:Tripartite tricarboxylate transporter TctB family protein n=1 Tax=Pelagicoccus mobilis TaxID=415221 RepID=A0A934RZT2_9BACT|nr:tripartite tricarboxylate transporter substrate-binding protein [Pelagicoccus mobilis]MBK1879752.1 tripartite tricarboxylate transporter TctB family protein [Pelagicoccus mobilis]